MKHILNSEEAWLEIRNKYITASEAAVLVGLNPYSSPGKLKKDIGFYGNASTMLGQFLESVVVKLTNFSLNEQFELFETVKGKEFYTRGSLGATPDAGNGQYLLECKTTRPDKYEIYQSEPPLTYLLQLQIQLHCTQLMEGRLAIISTDLTQWSQEPQWPISIFKVVYNSAVCDIIEQEAQRFFKNEKPFRAKSEYKRKVGILLHMSCEKIV